jgi:uncharacterized protein YhaN
MHVERLRIRGYRRLRGDHAFAPGLTLVTGPNEAGKSTLHDAVLRSLFGFSPEERRHRRDGSSAKDERMPWAGGAFGVTLHAHDPRGRAVLVKWDFAGDLVELQDALTGESLLRERPKQRADFEIGRRLVGMTREEFVQVCCLHQQALDTVRPSDELHQALQRAVESAPAQDIGVQGADDRLKKLLSGLGVQSGHYGELPNGELGRLKAREEALRRELESARAQRAELDGVAASLAETQTTRASLGGSATGLQQAPAYPRELVGREGELRNQLARLDARESTLQAEDARESALRVEGARESTLQAEDARESVLRVEGARESAPQAEGDRLTDGAFAPSTDNTFAPPTDTTVAPPAGRWNGRLLGAAFVLAAIGAIGAALVHPALAALLLAAGACAWAGRPRPGRAIPQPAGADPAQEARLREARLQEARLHDARLHELHELREGPLEELRALYRQAGLDSDDLAAAAAAFAERARAAQQSEERLRQIDIQIAQGQTVIEQREMDLSDPAELEVELADVHARREQIELTRDAIRIARETLREAAQATHRRVAPHLNEALQRELPRITRGRYAEGAVDEDLAIKLYAPESGALVPIDQLSRGTRDQVALIQRLEIARLLDPTAGRAPLLLDDPFAHFDSERLRLGVQLIAEVAERRQVILFTEDREVIERVQEADPACALIELPDPVGQIADASQTSAAIVADALAGT